MKGVILEIMFQGVIARTFIMIIILPVGLMRFGKDLENFKNKNKKFIFFSFFPLIAKKSVVCLLNTFILKFSGVVAN